MAVPEILEPPGPVFVLERYAIPTACLSRIGEFLNVIGLVRSRRSSSSSIPPESGPPESGNPRSMPYDKPAFTEESCLYEINAYYLKERKKRGKREGSDLLT